MKKETITERTSRVQNMIAFHKKRIEESNIKADANLGCLMLKQDQIHKQISSLVGQKVSLFNQTNALKELEEQPTSQIKYDAFLDLFNQPIDTSNTSVQYILNKDIVLNYLDNLIGWDNTDFLTVKTIIEKYHKQLQNLEVFVD